MGYVNPLEGNKHGFVKSHPGAPIGDTVDGSEIRRSPVEVGSLSHDLQGFVHLRWLAGFVPSTVGLSFCDEFWHFTGDVRSRDMSYI